MGLAGPRIKQRLGLDPQNKAWAEDKSKFGLKMMEKMGWSEGKGLGAREDGVRENIKVRLKDNNLGIGATKKSINNWLGNTDAFSQLLADLNQRVEEDEKGSSSASDDKKDDESSSSESEEEEEDKKNKKKSKKEKKDKKSSKKDKKEKKEKKNKKASKKDESDSDSDSNGANGIDKKVIAAAISGRKASRHKYLKNKHAAIQNAERLNEILGIRSETASPATSGVSTPTLDDATAAADGALRPTSMSSMTVRHAEDDYNKYDDDENDKPSRPAFGGLGFATSSGLGSMGYNSGGLRGLGFVKATVTAIKSSTIEEEEDKAHHQKMVTETTTTTTTTTTTVTVEEKEEHKEGKEEKKAKKEKKDKKDKSEKKDKSDKKEKKEKSKKRKAESEDGEKKKKSKK